MEKGLMSWATKKIKKQNKEEEEEGEEGEEYASLSFSSQLSFLNTPISLSPLFHFCHNYYHTNNVKFSGLQAQASVFRARASGWLGSFLGFYWAFVCSTLLLSSLDQQPPRPGYVLLMVNNRSTRDEWNITFAHIPLARSLTEKYNPSTFMYCNVMWREGVKMWEE